MTPASQRPFRVGLVQTSCSPDPAANLEKAAVKVREAAQAGAELAERMERAGNFSRLARLKEHGFYASKFVF